MKKKVWFTSVLAAIATVMLGASCASPAIETSTRAAPGSKNTVSNPVIAITYTAAFAGQTASGNLKLVVDMTIKNSGYESFNTSPANFSVVVNNYSYDAAESDLQTVDLLDGDEIGGKLAFQVPAVAASTRVGYQMAYSGLAPHNVQWFKQSNSSFSATSTPASNPTIEIAYLGNLMWVKDSGSLYLVVDMAIENTGYESFNTSPEYFSLVLGNIFGQSTPTPPISFDGAYSDLRAFDLQNGGKLNGTLAFQVPTNILASTESYRMEYSGVRAYNVQWSMKPYNQ